jgi:hypothetical protein
MSSRINNRGVPLMTRQTLFVLSGLLLAGLSSWAADEPVQACAAIADDPERLRCYDRAANPAPEPAAEAPPAVAAEPEPELPPKPEPKPKPAQAAPSEAPAVDPVAEFGIDRKSSDDEIKEIRAIAVEVVRRSHSGLVVTLDNGQVWAEKDAEPYFRVRVGDEIKIKRVSMGGYRMVSRGNRVSQVRRIK